MPSQPLPAHLKDNIQNTAFLLAVDSLGEIHEEGQINAYISGRRHQQDFGVTRELSN